MHILSLSLSHSYELAIDLYSSAAIYLWLEPRVSLAKRGIKENRKSHSLTLILLHNQRIFLL